MKLTIEFSSLEEMAEFLSVRGIKTEGIKKTPIKGLGLTVRAQNCMLAAGYQYIEDAQAAGMWGLLKIPNVGRRTACEVMEWRPANEAAPQP